MRINHNIAALNTYRQLGSANAAQQNSMEKLSSGLRINSAKDDAAGLAISEKMRGQIRGLDMASKNAQDANSLIQTAEGALNETHDILQRMRELSVQSANDTNTDSDRSEIQKEINQLTEEIDRIGNTTEFNTQKLIDGSASKSKVATSNVGANLGNVSNVTASNITAGAYTLNIEEVAAAADATLSGSGAVQTNGDNNVSGEDITAAASLNAGRTAGDVKYEGQVYVTVTTGGAAGTAKLSFGTTEGGDDLGKDITWSTSATAVGLTGAASGVEFTLTNGGGGSNTLAVGDKFEFTISKADTQEHYEAQVDSGAKVSFANRESGVTLSAGGGTISFNAGDISAMTAGSGNKEAITLTVSEDGGKKFQIGSNKGQNMTVDISDMRAGALGVDSLNVTTQSGADAAIATVDKAIASVSAERSKLGAFQNRLDHTVNNLNTSSENLTAAESRIRDVDYALAA